MGQIEENADTLTGRLDLPPFAPGGTALSYFDVFFEIEVPGIGVLHNNDPSCLETTITHKPPQDDDTYKKTAGRIELFDEDNEPTGIFLVSADHQPDLPPLKGDMDFDGDVDFDDIGRFVDRLEPDVRLMSGSASTVAAAVAARALADSPSAAADSESVWSSDTDWRLESRLDLDVARPVRRRS